MSSGEAYSMSGTGEWGPPPANSRRMSRTALIVFYSVLLVASMLAALVAPTEISAGYMLLSVVMATAILIVQIVHYATGPKPVNWITPDMVFLLMFHIIHYIIPLYYVLGLVTDSHRVWINTNVVNYATMMSVSGISAFYIGLHALAERHNRVRIPEFVDQYTAERWQGIGKLIFFVAVGSSLLYLTLVGGSLTQGQYTGQLGGLGTKMILLMFSILLYTSIAMLSVSAGMRSGKWKIGLMIKLLFCLFVFGSVILGDRSLTMMACLVAAAGFSEYAKPFSFKKLAIGMVAGMLLMGFVRVVRQSEDRTPMGLIRAAKNNPDALRWDQGLLNLAGSANTLYAAVNVTPERYPYFYGRLKVSGVLGIMPFSRRIFPVKRIEYTSSALFLTYVINKGDFTSGAGSSIIADCYLGFGYPGVIVIMALLGALCKHIQQKARSTSSLTWGVAHVCLVPWMALMARNEFTSLIRGVLWPVLIVTVTGVIFGARRRFAQDPAYAYDGYDDEYDEFYEDHPDDLAAAEDYQSV